MALAYLFRAAAYLATLEIDNLTIQNCLVVPEIHNRPAVHNT